MVSCDHKTISIQITSPRFKCIDDIKNYFLELNIDTLELSFSLSKALCFPSG